MQDHCRMVTLQVVTASEAKGKAVYGGKDVLAQAKKRYGFSVSELLIYFRITRFFKM